MTHRKTDTPQIMCKPSKPRQLFYAGDWFEAKDVPTCRAFLRAALTSKWIQSYPGECPITQAHHEEAMADIAGAWIGNLPPEHELW